MTDPIRKEVFESTNQTVNPGETDVVQSQGTIFIGGDTLLGNEWVVTPESQTASWEFIDGKLYKYEDWTSLEIANSQGVDVTPGIYVKVKPVDIEDFNSPSLVEDITHAINTVLSRKMNLVNENIKYGLTPTRYLEKERLLLIKLEPVTR